MSSLFDSLQVALKTMGNLQTGISVVNDNVANVNTPGYTRKRVIFEESPPVITPEGAIGTGADVLRIEAARSEFLDRRILSEQQIQGNLAGQQFALEQIESVLYNEGQPGISDQLTKFFNSMSELASDSSSLSRRQVVLGEGAKLADSIRSAYNTLSSLREANRTEAKNSVDKINLLLGQIADLNVELEPLVSLGMDGGSLQDQRQELMGQLADQLDFVSYQDDSGAMTITTSGGTPLVVGGESNRLVLEESNDGIRIKVDGADVTADLNNGRLAAYEKIDAETIPSYLAGLNQFAEALADEVNSIHASGAGLDGVSGRDFFTYSATDPVGSLQVALTDPAAVAAAAVGAGAGDGTVAQQMADLRDQSVTSLGGNSLADFYSNMVFQSGLDARYVQDSLANQQKVLTQLQNQRDSVSGVSLDEEAVNLILLQRSYQASSRFIQVVNSLLQETMNLIG